MGNNSWIILAGVLVVLFLIIKSIIKFAFYKKIYTDIISKPFVCPNCGCRFYAKWWQIALRPNLDLSRYHNAAILKCPQCNTKDRCQRPYDEV